MDVSFSVDLLSNRSKCVRLNEGDGRRLRYRRDWVCAARVNEGVLGLTGMVDSGHTGHPVDGFQFILMVF